MKTFKLILSLALLTLISQSCHKGGPWGIKGKGENVTETKDLSGFDRIHLSIDADIYFTQDSVYKVEISAQPNILAVMKAEVNNYTLSFDYRRNVWDHNKVKITIHAPDLRAVNISGSGDFNFQNEMNTNNLELTISGSGNIYFPELNAKNLKLNVSGSGDVKIANGTLISEDFTISGAGNVDAVSLTAQSAEVNVSGFGDIKVNVTENLDVTISGSGSVSYKGNPSVSRNISGSGKLIHLN